MCINVSNDTKVVLLSEIGKDSPAMKEMIFQRLNAYRNEVELIIYKKQIECVKIYIKRRGGWGEEREGWRHENHVNDIITYHLQETIWMCKYSFSGKDIKDIFITHQNNWRNCYEQWAQRTGNFQSLTYIALSHLGKLIILIFKTGYPYPIIL